MSRGCLPPVPSSDRDVFRDRPFSTYQWGGGVIGIAYIGIIGIAYTMRTGGERSGPMRTYCLNQSSNASSSASSILVSG